jgi:outer membrane murein-binding lipoprotein Lpp
VLTRAQSREGHGLRFDELQERVLPNLELPSNALRQRLKQVASYDKNTQIWTTKPIGFEEYPGVDTLGKTISPESVAAFESACAASRRLADLGIQQLYSGSHTVVSVGVAMMYLAGQLNAARILSRKTKKLVTDVSHLTNKIDKMTLEFYEKAAMELESTFKYLKQKHEIAQFIYEELQLAPWHMTGEFIDVHKKAEGTGMMKLTGLGDPSGIGEGFSFLREADTKPNKSIGNAALNNDQVKKITGTEDDLRKLTMKQMAALLRSFGLTQDRIDTLK